MYLNFYVLESNFEQKDRRIVLESVSFSKSETTSGQIFTQKNV